MKIVVFSDQLTEPLRAALSPRDTIYRSDLNGGHDNADVIVYALQLDADGYQMLRDSRDKNPRLRTIVVTDTPVLPEAVYVLRGGATSLAYDYLDVKDKRFEARLTAVVDEVNLVTYGDIEVRIEQKVAYYKGKLLPLTPTETDILVVFLRNPGKGIRHEQIAEAIYGERLSAKESLSRLKTHIWSMRGKLRTAVGREAIVNREAVGYVLVI